MDVLPELLNVECIVVLELLDAEFQFLLVLLDDVVLGVLLGPFVVFEIHLVQLPDGLVVVDPCAGFLGHDIGSELLMPSSLRFVYEDVVDVLLQLVLSTLDVQVVHLVVVV